ncbi:MAG: MCE family protein [Rhodococcus sp. (in: high G+C Gram-positive bacteria)]|nr:MCE family protein [Rhodococcus sp. (in: high G+C Gram-positive bacteria)]MDX5451576.1 MCE family protein [Rhodococcus sp. (in: high G+C Gram-positive bacteria)]
MTTQQATASGPAVTAPPPPRRESRRRRRDGTGRAGAALVGVVAVVVVAVAGALLVASGSGGLSREPEVTAVVPAGAGVIHGAAGVQYRGVHVGRLVHHAAGLASSRSTMRLDARALRNIPASVQLRIVPRTLFGDVFLELVPAADPATGPRLRAGTQIPVDTSAEAVQLANLYYTTTDLLRELRPDLLAVTLDAMSQALAGRGESLGRTLDRSVALTEQLGPLIDEGLASAPQLAAVTESMAAATDDLVATQQNAAELSEIALERRDGVARLLRGGAALAADGSTLIAQNTERMIAVVRDGAPVLETFAADTVGLDDTLRHLTTFGDAGARVFATGRFDITAVADFSDPMPYTAADCPRYPGMDGANCDDPVRTSPIDRQPVLSAAAEREPLGYLEQIAGGADPSDPAATGTNPSTAASILLAPLVRGTEVEVS